MQAERVPGPPVDKSSENFQLMATYLSLAGSGLGVAIFAVFLGRKPKQHERLLLVVDDLDRCDPDQMIAVIESLRLFLDEQEMSQRLQVAMLLDRTIFKRAMVNRGWRLGMLEKGSSESKFFREQEEKLFVAGLELPPLMSDQVGVVARKIIDQEYRTQLREQLHSVEEAERKVSPNETNASQVNSGANAAAEKQKILAKLVEAGEDEPVQPQTDQKPADREIDFTDDERRLMKEELAKLEPSELTPRSLRAFVIRYQLVRLILRHLNLRVDEPSSVITGLAALLFSESNIQTPPLSLKGARCGGASIGCGGIHPGKGLLGMPHTGRIICPPGAGETSGLQRGNVVVQSFSSGPFQGLPAGGFAAHIIREGEVGEELAIALPHSPDTALA
jgi:hypothetical protein